MQVRGLQEYWQRRTRHDPSPPDVARRERVLLDMLGLGLEQTIAYLAAEAPAYQTFTAWIIATAGPPDPDRILRYHAVIDGTPPPPATAAHLAHIEALPDALGRDDLAHWDTHGYVILRSAITREEAGAAAGMLWEAVAARPDDPATWYGPRNNGLMVQLFQHPALEPARGSPRVHKAFAQLWGTADLWSTTDRLSFSAPETTRHAFCAPRLHWDVSLARPIPFATQGILYLSDTAEDQGALELVPGFHCRIDAWLDGLGGADPRQVDLSADAVRIAANAGDLIIWRQDLPHGASPNRVATPRLAQYVNMYSVDQTVHDEWL
jgi:hypothetical protein